MLQIEQARSNCMFDSQSQSQSKWTLCMVMFVVESPTQDPRCMVPGESQGGYMQSYIYDLKCLIRTVHEPHQILASYIDNCS